MGRWLEHLEALGVLEKVHLEAGEERLSDLFQRGPVHRCRSRLLGEDVLFVADDVEVPTGNALVVYRRNELAQVVGRTPAELRAIHAVKKLFDGQVEENGDFSRCKKSAVDPPTP